MRASVAVGEGRELGIAGGTRAGSARPWLASGSEHGVAALEAGALGVLAQGRGNGGVGGPAMGALSMARTRSNTAWQESVAG